MFFHLNKKKIPRYKTAIIRQSILFDLPRCRSLQKFATSALMPAPLISAIAACI